MTLVRRASAVSHPALCSVTASGQNRRPAAARSSASTDHPTRSKADLAGTPVHVALWVTVSARNLVRKVQRKDFSGASVNAELRPWEPGPSLASLKCDPSKMREFQQNGDKIMYQNKVSLIGFLGGDAEVRNANNRSFTTLSLATKSSYKDKKSGQYVAQTEWHRCVVFGKLAEFAATLTKGAHVQIEGELRSREIAAKNSDFKRRIWEIRVDSILKLDRAEKAGPEDQDAGEEPAA